MANSFVLKGNIIYSVSLEELKEVVNGYIVVIDGKSEGVFTSLDEKYKALPLYDYKDALIVPGLIDLHIHAPQFGFRGMALDLELMEWLEKYTFPEEAKFSEIEYAEKAYSIFVDALRKSATTRLVVFASRHREATVLLMDKLERSGLISYVGKVNMDRLAPSPLKEESAEVSEKETRLWLDEIRGRYKNTKPILTPRFVPSVSDSLMGKLELIRDEYDLPVQSHLSENPNEIELVKELAPYSRFYGDAYNHFNLFGGNNNKCIMAHCVYSKEEEIALMAKNHVTVAHCPESNENLSSGLAPIRKFLDSSISVGLGSDIGAGTTESIFFALTEARRVSKMYWRLVDDRYKPLSFKEAFFLATMGGGKFFGNVGSFMKGYDFDALVLSDENLPSPLELSPSERLERFCYLRGDEKGIKAKFVNGVKLF